MIPLSILDLASVRQGTTVADAFRDTVTLAQAAEAAGFSRFWLAEHHGMPGVASAATAVLIGHVAGATRTIRVGAGGIMLPNHAPLQVAEQFGTLAALYPDRIDLGLGRAPGTDGITSRALRRDPAAADTFPQDVVELRQYFEPHQPGRTVRAIPGEGLRVPLWILGSSTFGARLAAELGLPYAFASHFAPAQMREAAHIYRSRFRPSAQCPKPHLMLGVNAVVADTEDQARYLFTTLQRLFVELRRGTPGQIPPPMDHIESWWQPHEATGVMQALSCSAVGTPEQVRAALGAFVEEHRPDELMVASQIFDVVARVRSYALLAEAMGLKPPPPSSMA